MITQFAAPYRKPLATGHAFIHTSVTQSHLLQSRNCARVNGLEEYPMPTRKEQSPQTDEDERITVTLPGDLARRLDQEVGDRRAHRRQRFGGRPGPYTRSDLIAEELARLLPPLRKT